MMLAWQQQQGSTAERPDLVLSTFLDSTPGFGLLDNEDAIRISLCLTRDMIIWELRVCLVLDSPVTVQGRLWEEDRWWRFCRCHCQGGSGSEGRSGPHLRDTQTGCPRCFPRWSTPKSPHTGNMQCFDFRILEKSMLATPCCKHLYWQHLVAQGSIIVTVWKSEVNLGRPRLLLLWITNHYIICNPIFDCDPHQLFWHFFRHAYLDLLLHLPLYAGYVGRPVALALSAKPSPFIIMLS